MRKRVPRLPLGHTTETVVAEPATAGSLSLTQCQEERRDAVFDLVDVVPQLGEGDKNMDQSRLQTITLSGTTPRTKHGILQPKGTNRAPV